LINKFRNKNIKYIKENKASEFFCFESLEEWGTSIPHYGKTYSLKWRIHFWQKLTDRIFSFVRFSIIYALAIFATISSAIKFAVANFPLLWYRITSPSHRLIVGISVVSVLTIVIVYASGSHRNALLANVDTNSGEPSVLVFDNYLRVHKIPRPHYKSPYSSVNYWVRSPQKIFSNKKYAILLFLHGSQKGVGDSAKSIAVNNWLGSEGLEHHYRYSTYRGIVKDGIEPLELSDEDDSLIVVFPQTPTPPIWDQEDLRFLASVMDDFREKYPVSNFDFYIGGFSDGAYFASRYFLEGKFRVSGLVVLAGGLYPRAFYDKEEVAMKFSANSIPINIPIFLGVGLDDGMKAWIRHSYQQFSKLGHPITYKTYPRKGHYVNNEEVQDIKNWISKNSSVNIIKKYSLKKKYLKQLSELMYKSKNKDAGPGALSSKKATN